MKNAREEIVGRKEELWFSAPAIPLLSLDNVNTSLIDDGKENCIDLGKRIANQKARKNITNM